MVLFVLFVCWKISLGPECENCTVLLRMLEIETLLFLT